LRDRLRIEQDGFGSGYSAGETESPEAGGQGNEGA
jgi:hypothetical protein